MTITQLAYFVAMAETLSFTIVAERFFVTQPTLSRQIRNMEEELGFDLFERRNNTVRLTQEGAAFYEGAKPIHRQYHALVAEVRRMNEKQPAVFRIGLAEELLLDDVVELAINLLRAQYPALNVTIQRATYAELNQGLLDGTYDIANTMLMGSHLLPEGLSCMQIAEESAYLAISRKLEPAFPDKLTRASLREVLRQYRVLFPVADSVEQRIDPFAEFLDNYGPFDFKPELLLVGSPISLPIQVTSGLGVTICNRSNLFAIDPVAAMIEIEGGPAYTKCLLYADHTASPYLSDFLKLVGEKLAERHELD